MATITVPQVVPSPVEDAEALMKAFQGYIIPEIYLAVLVYRFILVHRS